MPRRAQEAGGEAGALQLPVAPLGTVMSGTAMRGPVPQPHTNGAMLIPQPAHPQQDVAPERLFFAFQRPGHASHPHHTSRNTRRAAPASF